MVFSADSPSGADFDDFVFAMPVESEPLRCTLPASGRVYAGTTDVGYLGPTLAVPAALNATIAPHVNGVWYYDRVAPPDVSPWSLWNAQLPGPLQGFMELRFGEAYFVVSREEAVWQFAPGAHPDVADRVALVRGGNNVVYLWATELIGEMFAPDGEGGAAAASGLDTIWRLDPSGDPIKPWRLWAEALPVPLRGFADLVTGQAYFITVTKPVDLPFPPCPSPPTEGLVAWYPFDGNANDASGHGWNGTVLGPTLDADRFGRPGSCRWRSSHRWQGC